MPGLPPTKTAPPNQRGGTYERDTTVRALLWYSTHIIHELRQDQKLTTFGSATDRDIRIVAEHISAHHGRIERRARGVMLIDERSKNSTYHDTKRFFGLGLKASFEETHVPPEGVHLRPGMTFVVGDLPHRYIAIDDAIRKHHAALLDILGTEDEVRGVPELVSPSDFILAADSGGHMLITGDPGCGQEELADIVHKISKRRGRPFVKRDHVPDDLEAQNAIVKDEANKATLLLRLGANAKPFDPRFVTSLFSPSYQIRVIALARTVDQARDVFGTPHLQPMMHIALRPLSDRRAAVHPLLDRCFAAYGNPTRVADLTPKNQHALLAHDWGDLADLRETAKRLDAIIRAPNLSLNKARKKLGVARNTFYSWFKNTVRLTKPLLAEEREPVLRAALASKAQTSEATSTDDEDLDDDDDDDRSDDE